MPGSIFEKYNRTELYQTCRHAGIACMPNEPKEKLIAYLEGEAEPDSATVNEFDRWRHGLMGFILEYWQKIESQLTCPARSKDPLSCFQCVDQQVVACLAQNKPHEQLIRIHLPNGERR
jgi:hypothetical protein